MHTWRVLTATGNRVDVTAARVELRDGALVFFASNAPGATPTAMYSRWLECTLL